MVSLVVNGGSYNITFNNTNWQTLYDRYNGQSPFDFSFIKFNALRTSVNFSQYNDVTGVTHSEGFIYFKENFDINLLKNGVATHIISDVEDFILLDSEHMLLIDYPDSLIPSGFSDDVFKEYLESRGEINDMIFSLYDLNLSTGNMKLVANNVTDVEEIGGSADSVVVWTERDSRPVLDYAVLNGSSFILHEQQLNMDRSSAVYDSSNAVVTIAPASGTEFVLEEGNMESTKIKLTLKEAVNYEVEVIASITQPGYADDVVLNRIVIPAYTTEYTTVLGYAVNDNELEPIELGTLTFSVKAIGDDVAIAGNKSFGLRVENELTRPATITPDALALSSKIQLYKSALIDSAIGLNIQYSDELVSLYKSLSTASLESERKLISASINNVKAAQFEAYSGVMQKAGLAVGVFVDTSVAAANLYSSIQIAHNPEDIRLAYRSASADIIDAALKTAVLYSGSAIIASIALTVGAPIMGSIVVGFAATYAYDQYFSPYLKDAIRSDFDKLFPEQSSGGDVIDGRLVNGYLSGSIVFTDTNGNSMFDLGEASVTTGTNGEFSLVRDGANIVAIGGFNTASGLHFNGLLKGTSDSVVISPLTTVMVELGGTADAEAKVKAAFGLNQNLDLSSLDYFARALDGDAAASKAALASMQIIDTAILTASLIAGADGTTAAGEAGNVFAAMAAALNAANGQPINLSDPAILTQIARSAAAAAGNSTLTNADFAALAAVLQDSNAALQALTGTGANLLSAAYGVVKVIQGQAADAFVAAAGNTSAIATAGQSFSGASLASAITAATDTVTPTLASATPADDTTGVNAAANLVLTFSENVFFGTGAVELHQSGSGTLVEAFNVVNPPAGLSLSGSVLTINPTADLSANTGYYLTVAPGALRDGVGHEVTGLTTATALNFTTAAASSGGGGSGGSTGGTTPTPAGPVSSATNADGSVTLTLGQAQTSIQLAPFATSGKDTVVSAFSVTVPDGIENVTLTGTGNVSATGNSGSNVIGDNAGNNDLAGGGGSDRFVLSGGIDKVDGGLGADLVILDQPFSALTFMTNIDGSIVVSYQGGSAQLNGVELLQTSDGLRLLSPPAANIGGVPFDEGFYLRENPDVAAAVKAGSFASGRDHFMTHGVDEGRNATPLFNTDAYLTANPDVAAAVKAGQLTAFQHFLQFGEKEGRTASKFFDADSYYAANPDVKAAGISAIQHLYEYGVSESRVLGVSEMDAFTA